MTGRGAGWCGGNDAAGFAVPVPGRGRGLGLGRPGRRGGGGWGWRQMHFAPGRPGWARSPDVVVAPSVEAEVADLKAEATWLEASLNAIKTRIQALAQSGTSSDE